MKKIVAVLLTIFVLISIISIIPAAVNAEEIIVDQTGEMSGITGDCTWKLDDDGVLTISGNGEMGKYWIWSDDYAPWGKEINSVIIEPGVTNISSYAFYRCELKSITIPDTVTSIGYAAFEHCSKLESITIPRSVTFIGQWAFKHCGFKEITIPSSVENINSYTFIECYDLEKVILPESVTVIDHAAFENCHSLKTIKYLIP